MSSDPASLARALAEAVGPRLTAYMAGLEEYELAALTDGRRPASDADVSRLRVAAEVVELLYTQDDLATVRAWLIGMAEELGDRSPAEGIRDGEADAVVAIARAYLRSG